MDFYRDSTWVLEYLEQQEGKGRISGSLQSLVLRSCQKYKIKSDARRIYAVVDSCWKYKQYLETIMRKSGLLEHIPKRKGKPQFERLTLLLLCHDLLVSKSARIQMGKHPIKTYVLQNKNRLHSELVKLKLKLKVKDLSEVVNDGSQNSDETPVRWIRINPAFSSKEGFIDSVIQTLEKKFTQRVDHWSKIVPGSIYKDEFIPHLYGIHPKDKITSHELYKQGKIIIQDRASCIPAVVLDAGADDVVIDACAAPGNKTTHVTATMLEKCDPDERNVTVHAFEKNPDRAKILEKMLKTARCDRFVTVNVGDFTKIATPAKFPTTTAFLLDPSCSGSGIFGRQTVDNWNERKKSSNEEQPEDSLQEEVAMRSKNEDDLKRRLSKLASFQFQMVKHAMSFPKARKLVYSTCSIHSEENERVVIDLLMDEQVKKWGWTVAPRAKVIPSWPRRGLVEEFQEVFRDNSDQCEKLAGGCIRVKPREDGGIGFFAACFERTV